MEPGSVVSSFCEPFEGGGGATVIQAAAASLAFLGEHSPAVPSGAPAGMLEVEGAADAEGSSKTLGAALTNEALEVVGTPDAVIPDDAEDSSETPDDAEGSSETLVTVMTDGALEAEGCSNGASDGAVDIVGTLEGAPVGTIDALGTYEPWIAGQPVVLGASEVALGASEGMPDGRVLIEGTDETGRLGRNARHGAHGRGAQSCRLF